MWTILYGDRAGRFWVAFPGRSISKTDPNDFWRIRWQEFHLANQMAEFYPERLIRLWVQHLVNSILSSIFGHWTQTGQVYWGQDIVSPTKKFWGQRIFDDQMPLRNATIIIAKDVSVRHFRDGQNIKKLNRRKIQEEKDHNCSYQISVKSGCMD